MTLNKNILWIIIKYSLLILLLRFLSTLLVESLVMLFGESFLNIFALAFFLPIAFLVWLISYNGTKKLGSYIKNKRTLEIWGLVIPGMPLLLDGIANFIFVGDLTFGSLLTLFVIGIMGVSRGTKEVFKSSK